MAIGLLVLGLLMALSILFIAIFGLQSRGKYEEYIENLDKKEWSLKEYLPIGFEIYSKTQNAALVNRLGAGYQNYKQNVYSKVLILYGKRRGAEQMYFVYQANKATLQVMILLFVAVFAFLGALVNQDISLGIKFWVIGLITLIGLPFLLDYDLDNKIKKRSDEILLQFPNFASKLVLLMQAGMTIPQGIRKIVVESEEDTVLMKELRAMLLEVDGGVSEAQALEDFARNCNVKEINRFISVLVQAYVRGGDNLSLMLTSQVDEIWAARKNLAKTMGQQASTKLVLPLTLMMLGIILLLAGPALIMFGQI